MAEQRWMGDIPKKCDLAGMVPGKHDMSEGFVDGGTQFGPWANMCLACHKVHGVGLGTGKGQRYDATGLKVEG
jgi:hypothetical protein